MIRIIEQGDARYVEPVDYCALVSEVFGQGGSLERLFGLEHRPQQESMALSVARSFSKGESLLFEAGTGVGKSLAYLFPGVLHAMSQNRPFVVATNTISLQEQLLKQDIPMLQDIFAKVPSLEEFVGFRSALLVGKANYLCNNRLASALGGQGELFESGKRTELERIREWANDNPKEGIRQELSPKPNAEVWDMINADSSLCSGKRCSPETCFYRKARSELEKAHLLVVNHSLLFALVGAGAAPSEDVPGVLFPRDFVVFDEAHEVPQVASDHLGLGISSWALSLALKRLYNPLGKKSGLLLRVGGPEDFELVDNARIACEDFFDHVHVGLLQNRDLFRLREAGILPSDVFPPLSRLSRRLRDLAEEISDEFLRTELQDLAKRLEGYMAAISEVVEIKDSESVYWVERVGRKGSVIHLRSAPLDVAKVLSEVLFARDTSVVLTSATLTRAGKADDFRNSVGAGDVSEKIETSPFDFEKNVEVMICADCPDPMAKERLPYLNALVEAIHHFASRNEGGSLVLFTNYGDLRHSYDVLRTRWKKMGRPIYAQGEGYSRTELRRRMRNEGNVLLLGAESFWKGFDVPGSSLSQLILTRLPFENPGHPLMEAKSERLNAVGKSPFREITLPFAVTRFRQGLGRLIRRRSDSGRIVILDSRVMHKSYGKDFLRELPKQSFKVFRLSESLSK